MDTYDWKESLSEFAKRYDIDIQIIAYGYPTNFRIKFYKNVYYRVFILDEDRPDLIVRIAEIKSSVLEDLCLQREDELDVFSPREPMTIEEIDLAMHRLSLQDWFKTEFDDYYYHVTLPELASKQFMSFISLKTYCQVFGL